MKSVNFGDTPESGRSSDSSSEQAVAWSQGNLGPQQKSVQFDSRPISIPVPGEGEASRESGQAQGRVSVGRRITITYKTTRSFLAWEWCQCQPLGWFNVRHLQITLISLLISFIAMTSNVRLIVAIIQAEKHIQWTRSQQMWAHTTYFFGQTSFFVCCWWMLEFIGEKLHVSLALVVMCSMVFATPYALWYGGYHAMISIRLACGFLSGSLAVMAHKFITSWNVRRENVSSYGMVLSGTHIGNAFLMTLVTVSYEQRRLFFINFLAIAAYGAAFLVIWLLFGSRDPDHCNYLSAKERKYLEKNRELLDEAPIKITTIPWYDIFSNYPFLAVIIAESAFKFGYWMCLSQAPLFFAEAVGYPFWKAGLVCALPHFLVWASIYPVGYTVQLFIRAKMISKTNARKICTTFALILGGGAFIALGATKTLLGAVTSYTTVVTFGMYHFMGAGVNHLDLAPRYAGLLLSLTHGLGNVAAVAAPALVTWVVEDLRNKKLWGDVYFFTGLLSMMGGLAYMISGSAEVQEFNYYNPP